MRTSPVAVCLLLSAWSFAASPFRARAEAGDNAFALPGIVRIGVPSDEQRPLALSASAGYGVTESLNGEGAHHRANGNLAASLGATRFLAFGLRLDGRYDQHPDDGMGGHGGWVGDPRVYARAGFALPESLRLGGELVAWLPGDSAPSLVPKAATLDLTALLAWSNQSGLELATRLGVRWDHSGESAPSNARLRAGDRLALSVSDFDALLVGIGASQRFGAIELLAEWSADALLGSAAPSFARSPLRASAGARYHASNQLACELILDASLSGRPSLAPSSPHVPIEPRVSVQLGLRYAFSAERAPARQPQPQATSLEPRAEPRVAAPAQTASLDGHVLDQDGEPIDGASIRVQIADTSREAQSASDGSYALHDLPLGHAELTVEGEGFEPVHQGAEIVADGAQIELHVQRPASGQIRGLIRAFSGAGLPARIELKQLGLRTQADADGAFELNLPPGQYNVSIEMPGYSGQQRSVAVEKNGVTLLNVELRGRKP